MELRGVHVLADPEHLHGAGGGRRQEDGVLREPGAGLLVAHVGTERLRDAVEEEVGGAVVGQLDVGGTDGLGPGEVDDPALVPPQSPDAVAGPEEREVLLDHSVQQLRELRLHPQLRVRLVLPRHRRGEGAATHDDPRVVLQVQVGEGHGLQADALEVVDAEAAEVPEGGQFTIRGSVLGPGGEQQEGFHIPEASASAPAIAAALRRCPPLPAAAPVSSRSARPGR